MHQFRYIILFILLISLLPLPPADGVILSGVPSTASEPRQQTYTGLLAPLSQSSPFPDTTILDTFNHANGSPGSNWVGATDDYDVSDNRFEGSGGAIYWDTSFPANQEAFFTLPSIDSGASEIDLLLKSQGTGDCDLLEIYYNADEEFAQVYTCHNFGNWMQHGDDIPISLEPGDQFGARVTADGAVRIYHNGILTGTVNVSSEWPYRTSSGRIGLWLIDAGTTTIDDFGGGAFNITTPPTNPDLEVFGLPATGAITVTAEGRFLLVFDEEHNWQPGIWNDLSSDLEVNLSRNDGSALNDNVIQSPLEMYDGGWNNLSTALTSTLEIVTQTTSLVELRTAWLWETPNNNTFVVTTTHTIDKFGIWDVATVLTNLSGGSRTIGDGSQLLEYAFTNPNPLYNWTETLAPDGNSFTTTRNDGPEPFPSITVTRNGNSGIFGSDGDLNRYWAITGTLNLPNNGTWTAEWTNQIWINPDANDTQPPTAPTTLHTTGSTTTTLDLAWDASIDDTGVVSYTVFIDSLPIGSTTTTTYTLSGLTPNTLYPITVKAHDAVGNTSPASIILNAMTEALDTEPPSVPTDLQVTSQTDTSVGLAWEAATDNVAVVGYDIFGGATLLESSSSITTTVSELEPGATYIFTVVARDAAGNQSAYSSPVTVTLDDSFPPSTPTNLQLLEVSDHLAVLQWEPVNDAGGLAGYEVYANGLLAATSVTTGTVVLGLTAATHYTVTVRALDRSGNRSVSSASVNVTTTAEDHLPDDPSLIAPTLPHEVLADFATMAEFLYTGPNPIQTDIISATIQPERTAILRGLVTNTSGSPLPGVQVSVAQHPEFGQTLTRADGVFDLVVNGGNSLTIAYAKEGYLPIHRPIVAELRDFTWLPDVALVAVDTTTTTVTLDGSSPLQVARGSVATDDDGSRQATAIFPANTWAMLEFPDGTAEVIESATVQITEYTVGPNGQNAMPAPLPSNTGYTYAVELGIQEAFEQGASAVNFSTAVPIYVENFLDFPIGEAVPAGYYDRQLAKWIAAPNGRVIKILSISSGIAALDADGDNDADSADLALLPGISNDEREQLASLYLVGQELWRVPVEHFTPWDFNWAFGPPSDAIDPTGGPPEDFSRNDDPCELNGSIIECDNQTLGELLGITGTPFQLSYRSDRVTGRTTGNKARIPVSGPTALPSSLETMSLKIEVAGQRYTQEFSPDTDVETQFVWDGRSGYGSSVSGAAVAKIEVAFHYPLTYYSTQASFVASFARVGNTIAIGTNRTEATIQLKRNWAVPLEGRPASGNVEAEATTDLGLGGWSIDAQHRYDPTGKILYLGNGERQSVEGLHARELDLLAGTGAGATYPSDGSLASNALLYYPYSVLVAPDGSIYIADTGNERVRRIDVTGVITTVAGSGVTCTDPTDACGDGGLATEAELNYPVDLALDVEGNLYIADSGNYRVRRVDAVSGVITTVAGTGENEISGDGGPANEAALGNILALAFDSAGNLYISNANYNNSSIRVITATVGTITGNETVSTVVGGDYDECWPIEGGGCFGGDGGPAIDATITGPNDIAFDTEDRLFFADLANHRIRMVDATGVITTVVGNGESDYYGDGGLATDAGLVFPYSIAIAEDGSLFIGTAPGWIRRVDAYTGIITHYAGIGEEPFSGDGLPAMYTAFGIPFGLSFDTNGALLVADSHNHRIRRIDSNTIVTTIAGLGLPGYDVVDGNGGLATNAQLNSPSDLAAHADGTIYIADTDGHRIWQVRPDGAIIVVAGTGIQGENGSSGLGIEVQLDSPQGLALDENGNLYIADTGNTRILKLDTAGEISTIAGGGITTNLANAPFATQINLDTPTDVAVALDGTLYIAEAGRHRVLALGTDGRISSVIGDGTSGQCGCYGFGYSPQRAYTARLNTPTSITVDRQGQLYIADTGNNVVLRVVHDTVSSVAGGGSDFGEDAAPTNASLDQPIGVSMLDDTRLLIVEQGAERVRILTIDSTLTTARAVVTGINGQTIGSELNAPRAAIADAKGNLIVADTGNDRVLREEPPLPNYQRGGYLIPLRDGREVYEFTASGQHSRTIDAATNITLLRFAYNPQGWLERITDFNGLVTRIQYTFEPRTAVIISPYGKRTTLTIGNDGYVSSSTNPANETYEFEYDENGLLTQLTTPRGGISEFVYDSDGRLLRDTNPVGGFTALARIDSTASTGIYTVTVTNALSHTQTISLIGQTGMNSSERISVAANGATMRQYERMQGLVGGEYPRNSTSIDTRGITTTVEQIPDPIWGMAVPWPYRTTMIEPSGSTFMTMTVNRVVDLANDHNPLTLLEREETVTVNGRTMITHYDAINRTVTTSEPGGKQTVVILDLAGRPILEETSGRAPKVYTYDLLGRLISQTEGEGTEARITRFAYTPQGELERIIDPLGNVFRYSYDSVGRLTQQTLPTGHVLTYEYDDNGNLVRETDARGIATTYEYDLADRITAIVVDADSRAVRSEYTYDLADNLIEIVDDVGVGRRNATTTFTYEPVGEGPRYAIKSVTNPLDETTIYTYTIAGEPALVSDPLGRTTVMTYTAQGWLAAMSTPSGRTVSTSYNNDGLPISVTDPRGSITTYVYDAAKRLEQVIAGTVSVEGQSAVNQTLTFGYNAQSQVISTTNGLGQAVTRDYDLFGRLITETDSLSNTTTFNYDTIDRLVEQVVGANQPGEALTTRYTYDPIGRLLRQRVDPSGENLTTLYRYTQPNSDDTWNLQQFVDPQGHATHYTYNSLGLLESTTDAHQQTWSYAYDNMGALISQTDPLSRTTSYTIDDLGRTIALAHDSRTQEWAFDPDGTLRSFTDFAEQETSYTYDADLRLIGIGYPVGTSDVTFTYDAANNVTSVIDGLGTTTYTYDVLNRMHTRTRDGRTLTYSYDTADQLTQINYWGLGSVAYSYDQAGSLDSLTPWGASPTTYNYRSTGLLDEQERGNGVETAYRYDSASRLIGLGHTQSSTTLLDLSYSLDRNGNRTQIVEIGPTGTTPLTTTLAYDALNRLTQVDYPAIPSGPSAQTVNYGYDAVGNRTTVDGLSVFTYDASDRITNSGYVYDDNGNLLSDGETDYEYDAANRLISSTSEGIVTTYGYDGRGNLIKRTRIGITTDYVIDESGPLALTVGEIRSDFTSTLYAYGPEGITAQKTSAGVVSYPLLDAQGTLRSMTNSSGNSIAWRNYDAFGQNRASDGSWTSAFGFTGQLDDSSDGTVYLRARHYRPSLGRFLQRDSFGGYANAGQTQNRYAYSGNNPATYTDLSGHDFWGDLGKGLGELNKRVGPEAAKRSWDFAKRVGRRVHDDPGVIWRVLKSPCVLDALQTALDLMGMMPGVGAPFDVANAFLSGLRGNYADAGMRLMFAAPGLGDFMAGANLGRKGLSHADDADGFLRNLDDAARCLLNSFSPDTLVATPNGDVPISEIQVGDQVLAYNQKTGETGSYTVTAVLINLDPAQLHLTIAGEQITTTPEHPFYVLLRGWVAASALREGDQVYTADGEYGAVESVRLDPAPRLMYNLAIAEAHTFFVGEEAWLVHNANPGKCNRSGGYITHDVDRHGNLSPSSNRAPGHKPIARDNRIQSHHPIQDKWARTNVPNYNRNDAPAVLLPSMAGQSHAQITAAQQNAAAQRLQQGLDPWRSTTIREEFDFGYRIMINAGVPVDVARKAIKDAYKYFDSLGAFP